MEMSLPTKDVKKRKNITQIKRSLFIASFITIPILHFLFFQIYTNFGSIVLALEKFDKLTGTYKYVGLDNFREFFESFNTPGNHMLTAIKNSILFFLLNDFVIFPLSFISAYFMYKKIPFSNGFRIIFYLPSIISTVVLTMLFSFMFDSSIGIVDSILRKLGLERFISDLGWLGNPETAMPIVLLYCLWAGVGGNIVLLSGAMSRIPTEIIEAGKLDGLSMFQEMIHITIPLTGSLTATLLMLGVPVIFTIFLQPMLLTNGGPDGATTTIAMYIVNGIRTDNNLPMSATVSLICAFIGTPLVLSLRALVEKLFPAYEY